MVRRLANFRHWPEHREFRQQGLQVAHKDVAQACADKTGGVWFRPPSRAGSSSSAIPPATPGHSAIFDTWVMRVRRTNAVNAAKLAGVTAK